MGAVRSGLKYNLRQPKNQIEVWEQELAQGKITLREFGARLKADALRPIDLEMLTALFKASEAELNHYAGALQNAVIQPHEINTSVSREKERIIDGHIAALQEKLPLWKENLEKLFDFLQERRVTSGAGLLKLGRI